MIIRIFMQENNLGLHEENSRRSFLKNVVGLGFLALGKELEAKNIQERKEKNLEKLELSWSTQNGKTPADRGLQEVITHQFSEMAQVIWREQDRQSVKQNQIQIIILPDFEPERVQSYGLSLRQSDGEITGCVPKEIGQLALDNRIFVSLKGVSVVLKKDGVPITQKTVQFAIGLTVTHEIIHLLLGTNRSHDKNGLFSSRLNYSEKLDPQTIEQVRQELQRRKNIILSQNLESSL